MAQSGTGIRELGEGFGVEHVFRVALKHEVEPFEIIDFIENHFHLFPNGEILVDLFPSRVELTMLCLYFSYWHRMSHTLTL